MRRGAPCWKCLSQYEEHPQTCVVDRPYLFRCASAQRSRPEHLSRFCGRPKTGEENASRAIEPQSRKKEIRSRFLCRLYCLDVNRNRGSWKWESTYWVTQCKLSRVFSGVWGEMQNSEKILLSVFKYWVSNNRTKCNVNFSYS